MNEERAKNDSAYLSEVLATPVQSEKEAWIRYKHFNDYKARDYIAQAYKPLVERTARLIMRKKPALFDYADLVQSGTLGLLDAIDKFSPERNIKFSTYAPLRIRGAILDDINEIDWTPRSVREKIRKIIKATEEFENAQGHSPSVEELSKMLDIPVDKILESLHQKTRTFITAVNFDAVVTMESSLISQEERNSFVASSQHKNHSVEELVETQEDIKYLEKIIAKELLPDESKVLWLYYYENCTMKEIADRLNISNTKVSALRKSGITKLRNTLTAEDLAFGC